MRQVAPDEAAFRILSALFADEGVVAASSGAGTLAVFQRRGVHRVLHAIQCYGGALLTDSVGLGKTHMGLAIARHFTDAGHPVLAIIPSAIRRQWEVPLRRLDPAATVVTHASLSRGGYAHSLVGGSGLLLVDEAHAFRNPAARRYAAVARLAATRSVCLITATPVNNSLWDLYHLLRLFCADDAFASIGVHDMRCLFTELQQNGCDAGRLQSLLRLVLIRRTRADVASEIASAPASLRFPSLAPPVTVPYDADDGSGSHAEVLRSIAALRLDAFAPESAALMRFLLLKRFASSRPALLTTVRGLAQLQRERIGALREGFVLTPADGRLLGERGSRDQLVLRRLVLRPLEPHMDATALESVASADLELLRRIERAALASGGDRKLEALCALLLSTLASHKVLVFTEFRDTAEYLWRTLLPHGRVAMIHGSGAYLGAGRASRAAVVTRFAPVANGGRRVLPRECVRVLIATDVLAEGLNLQDCAHVVSYDLPWNPVRLIQRVGRIDRMGSPHDVVHSYNFVPDRQLDEYLALLRRLRLKLRAIDTAVGLEHVVVAADHGCPSDWGHLLSLDAASQVPYEADVTRGDEHLRSWLRGARMRFPITTEKAPCYTALASSLHDNLLPGDAFVVIAALQSAEPRAFRVRGRTLIEIDPAAIARACMAVDADEPDHCFQDHAARLFRRALNHVQRSSVRGSTTSVGSPSARLALRLLASLARIPGGPAPTQAALAERLVRDLGRSHALTTESLLAELTRVRDAPFDILAGQIQTALARDSDGIDRPDGSPSTMREWRPICAVFAVSRG